MTTKSTRVFESYRALLEAIAYRMLGSLAEAQDVVQDTFLRWMRADPDQVRSPKSWLTATCSRIALDVLKSARVQRTQYVGPWLPEPYLEGGDASGGAGNDVDDTVSMALMVALETLSPAERAAFLLHDVFEYRFEEIGEILDKTPTACRKLASRARSAVRAETPRFYATAEDHRALLSAFLNAARAGDLEGLKSMLAASVVLRSDGGGKAAAAPAPIRGDERVARFLVGVWSASQSRGAAMEAAESWHNGAPGAVIYQNGRPVTAISLDIEPGARRICGVYALRNPDKLRPFRRLRASLPTAPSVP